MAMQEGEYGVVITINTLFDCTGASAGALLVKRHNAASATSLTLALPTGADLIAGIWKYLTLAADFPLGAAGVYDVEIRVDFGGTKRLRELGEMLVAASVEAA